jgi:alkanesulfonate monooxygenase SsuD/methylene tetrahydromethanopterin reductase-like flavin-dependent oxidoreductase (luciferase family)
MMLRLLHEGRLVPVPPVETALRFLEGRERSPEAAPRRRRAIVGSPAKVREGVEALAREYGAEEVLIVTITHGHAARRRSYELVAEAFGLPAPVGRA